MEGYTNKKNIIWSTNNTKYTTKHKPYHSCNHECYNECEYSSHHELEPAPCPKPKPCSEPAPCPEPEPCCEPTPCPEPEPCCEPTPCPEPEPCCEPTPCPEPEPCCEPTPCPEPEPCCEPTPCPEPEPCCEPTPCPTSSMDSHYSKDTYICNNSYVCDDFMLLSYEDSKIFNEAIDGILDTKYTALFVSKKRDYTMVYYYLAKKSIGKSNQNGQLVLITVSVSHKKCINLISIAPAEICIKRLLPNFDCDTSLNIY